MNPQKFYSNGKLLITGEYLVLDGALALAVPTKYGQSLTVEPYEKRILKWESFDSDGKLWFETDLLINDGGQFANAAHHPIADRLLQILNATKKQNPRFLNIKTGLKVKTQMDFPINWGLGTSSTLINNISQWANIDPYELLKDTFGGSGYDIACAIHNVPITYQLGNHERTVIERTFNPEFKNHLYFVFLNKKQNSREGIAAYQKNKNDTDQALTEINAITNDMISCDNLKTFQFLMQSHETIISKVIKQQPVKETLFKDFKGSIKSLGAWGGDFVLAASEGQPETYFKERGFETIVPYANMVLQ
ncbi:GYDIA family GHMP kinase [Gelidibacter sp. F63206]|uniref:GYDIA family GHMP kinase n=1 Tax=Gelidibacter sp. F63206 TaxID=2926425 RepID=UPI001FF51B3D|nr:GYDIA family GHMP kinase [Gelidibacter sp. F63206]MCK0114543.1 GYDIA family GHMP kinase [Gelidibacter sp. F63206]